MTDQEPEWTNADTDLFVRFGDAFVPRREEQFRVIGDLLEYLPDPHILELACGEGRLTEALLRRLPGARVTAMDGSTRMLGSATRRLRRFGTRVRLVQAVLEDPNWRQGTYDAVVTSLALHHLDDDAKQELYHHLHAMIAPGGALVVADLVRPATDAAVASAAQSWDLEVERQSIALYGGSAAADAFHEAHWNTYRFPDLVDKPSLLAEHLRWLATAGFVHVDACWALAGHVVMTASRSSSS
ncbi:class I SAM-dependent methyltransferase [Streptacidiphilus sp. PAMC 29251]